MEDKKKSGLQKDISSIFSGLEEIDNGRQSQSASDPGSPPRPAGRGDSEFSTGPRPESPPGTSAIPPTYASVALAPLVLGGAFPKRRNSFVGLDIGSSAIKLVQIYPVSGGWEIGGYAIQELASAGDGRSPFENENFARRLKKIFAETGAPRGGVICALRGGEIVVNLVQLSRLPKNELESACRLEAGRWADFSIEKAFLQLMAVDKEPVRPGGKVNYIVTAVGRETVSRILGVLREGGLQAAALLPLSFAWKAYLLSILQVDKLSVVAVVDVGSTRTLVSIYRGAQLSFSREFESGGQQITEAIVQAGKTFGIAGGLPREEAERIKRNFDLFSADGARTVQGSLTVSQVGGMVRPVLEKIVQESKRSFDYFRQLYRQEEVGRIYLCGGGTMMPGFVEFFRDRVSQPVESLALTERIKLHNSLGAGEEVKPVFPRLARAIALSLSRKWEVNFIPPLDKILQNILRRKVMIIVPILAFFLVSYVFYRSKASLIPIQQRLVEQKRVELAALQEKLSPYPVLNALQRQLEAERQAGPAAAARRPNWRGILKEFSRITPRNVIITGIMTLKGEDPQRIICNGRVIDVAGVPQAGVTQFIVQVENSPFFREVEKISEDIERGTFSFSCTLIY